ncbi:MAG: Smr/MutS family protein [Treponema sp.]|jgi:DNA mismatch repair protein MutS2|nr:Smr/MutS family protein [Treponema sp.]
MNDKTLRLLEFDVILKRVAGCARSGEAAEQILGSLPLADGGEAAALKSLAGEVLERFRSGDEEGGGSLPDIGFLLPKLDVEGICLELDEAYALAVFVERGMALGKWLCPGEGRRAGEAGAEPSRLRALVRELPDCSAIPREVFRVLDREGKLRDLPEFQNIKARIRRLTGDLEAALARYLGNEETRRMLQSNVSSQRDGREVLALRANFRGRIKGIVHEVSSTGQTLFVEPEDVVEKNNDILIEKRHLDTEILRVLREMTGRVAGYRQSLAAFHRGILFLETIRARARYSFETRGNFARPGKGEVVLKQARHPLLGSQAVPIDLVMDGDTRMVIITGPNTGGKTVSLKTAGLFALMNQAGLALPAAEGTLLPFFDGIYADIGDEQSISQSLSTFSSHMTNIAAIIRAAGEDSLVLLDELGAGTDPEEGSAIAMAILDHLIAKRSRLITTTHHGILKNYGYTRQGVQNASVDFDRRTLSPTYRIIMGVPGESRAVDIAAQNGLPPALIGQARSYLREEQVDVSALISGLKKKYQELDAAAEAGKRETLRLREERRRADLKELKLRQQEMNLKAEGAGNLRRLLAESRKTLENLVREVKEGELSREKTLKVKEFLSELARTVQDEERALETEAGLLREEKRRLEAAYPPEEPSLRDGSGGTRGVSPEIAGRIPRNRPGSWEPFFAPGIEVLAGEYKRRGRILRPDKKGGWIVEIGSLRMSFPEEELLPLPPSEEEKKPFIAAADLAASSQVQFELSIRGMRLPEALDTLRRQIDAAALSGLWEFSVIHGKGDGVLQRGVHEFLKKEPLVADYYFSRPEKGGFGRTEVVLKS